VDNSGTVNIIDVVCIRDCADHGLCSCCTNGCDVNCDGTVDYVDFAAAWCEFEGRSDCCNEPIGACRIPQAGWPDCIETSQSPCEFFEGTYYGDGSTCDETCKATRGFEDAVYCPGRVKLIHIDLGAIPVNSGVAIEDSPPVNWTVGAISNGGSYDAVNDKVKWGPLFSPFPAEVTYEVTPDNAAEGQRCFSGIVSVDGASDSLCGEDCVNYQCCPYMAAETPQPPCALCNVSSCEGCTTGACLDASMSLCEVIAYGCAWVRGCNDDINGLTRAAFIWRNGECYCFDETAQEFITTDCGAGDSCCAAASVAVSPIVSAPTTTSTLSSVYRGVARDGTSTWELSIDVVPPIGTAGSAAELVIPTGWKVVSVGDDGAFDAEHGKIKWGPFFDDAVRTLTVSLQPKLGRTAGKSRMITSAQKLSLRGTVSFDGVDYPLVTRR
jgi:hypothetical protein